jgi:Replication-relaxation
MSPAPQTCLLTGKTVSTSQRSLTKRDIAILKDISDLRVATAKDVALLHFTPHSLTYGRERASFLAGNADHKEGEYLYRFLPPRSAKGNPERVYVLGSKGAQALTDITGMPVSWYYHPSKLKGVSFQFLRHSLLLTRIVAALTYLVRTHSEYSIIERRLFYELARMQLPVTGEGASNFQLLPVIPDAWVYLERPDGEATPLWIEADCGTEMRKKFQAYLKARIAFLQSDTVARILRSL